ncbi:ABC transporter permease [Flavobacterium psychrotrophum]|uniref:ABC transporter permease n=1 Tax=Flavobacterium psychrotrophum TaxID=2294119 RepID=UPI000E30BB52|nr:ABC transporter permease [Flavobacterium psychrotrophum]
MVKNWIKIFIYQIKNNKFFTALNLLGLSLGIAGLIFAILYWNDEHSYNAQNPNKDNSYLVVSDLGPGMIWGASAAPLGPRIAAEIPEVTEHCYMNTWYLNDVIAYNGKKEVATKIIDAQPNFFNFFPAKFIKGNPQTVLTPTSIALSEPLALQLFGTDNPIDKQVKYVDKTLTVKGIYKIESRSSYMPDAVISGIDAKFKNETQWGNYSWGLFVKLNDVTKAETVKQKIENLYYNYNTKVSAEKSNISPEEYIKLYGQTKIILEPIKDLRLKSVVEDMPEGKGNYQFLLIMTVLSVLILTMSVANYVNLATANAIRRAKEVGVRKILGAGTGNIIRQFLFETGVLTLFAILLALVIVEVSLPYYNIFLHKNLQLNNGQFYVQLAAIFILVLVVAGVFPAAYVSKFEAIQVLKGNFGRSKKGIWLRNAMLVIQFAIASFFIMGSYIVYSQVHYLTTKDPGFSAAQIVNIYYRNPYDYHVEGYRKAIAQKYEHIKERLSKVKGVQQVAAGTIDVGSNGGFLSGYTYNSTELSLQNMAIDFNLLEMLKVKIKEGRSLSEKFASDTVSSVLLNETAVKMLGIKKPLDDYIYFDQSTKLKIVGVVKDFHVSGLQEKIRPMAFMHYKSMDWMLQNAHALYIKTNPGETESALADIQQIWLEDIDPDFPFTYNFVDKNFARTYEQYIHQRNLFSLLNILVVTIALFGLFALASYSIQRRMKEIAIRKTLGADTNVLLKELSKQYVVFCIIGFIIAFVPAWLLLDKWLDNFAYRISISYLSFIVGFLALLVLTLAVVLGRAYAATRLNVLAYLKYE